MKNLYEKFRDKDSRKVGKLLEITTKKKKRLQMILKGILYTEEEEYPKSEKDLIRIVMN